MSQQHERSGTWQRRSTIALALAGLVGSAAMLVGHLGFRVPFLSGISPGRLILPAAIGFGFGTVAYAVVVLATWQRRRWGRWLALAVHGLALLSASVPFRGWFSAVAAGVAAAAIVVLLTPGAKQALGR